MNFCSSKVIVILNVILAMGMISCSTSSTLFSQREDSEFGVEFDQTRAPSSGGPIAMSRGTDRIHNSPGYIITPNSPLGRDSKYFKGNVMGGKDNYHGVDLRTPSEMLYKDADVKNESNQTIKSLALVKDGMPSLDAFNQRKGLLLFRDYSNFVYGCQQRESDLAHINCANIYMSWLSNEPHPEWIKLLPPQAQAFSVISKSDMEKLRSYKYLIKKDKRHDIIKYGIEKLELAFNKGTELAKAGRRLDDSKVINGAAGQEFLEPLFQSLFVIEALYSQQTDVGSELDTIKGGLNLLKSVHVRSDLPQSLDLVSPQYSNGETFVSPEILDANKIDSSLLNPQDDGLWRRPLHSISAYDVRNYDAINSRMANDEVLDRNRKTIVWFQDMARSRGRQPKFEGMIQYKGKDNTTKFVKAKVKLDVPLDMPNNYFDPGFAYARFQRGGMETMTEIVASTLANAIGYSVEPSFIKNSIRLLVPDPNEEIPTQMDRAYCDAYNVKFESRLHGMMTLLNGRLDNDGVTNVPAWDYNYFSKFVTGENDTETFGCKYVQIPFPALFPRNKDELKVGSFVKEAFGRPMRRAYRALQLFYAFVYDIDTHNFNATTKIVDDKILQVASDMGQSLGNLMDIDNVASYSPDLVKEVKYKKDATGKKVAASLTLSYHSGTDTVNQINEQISMNDAKWFARLLGEITPEQFLATFRTAGYQEDIAREFARKMVLRRNSLVRAVFPEGTTGVTGAPVLANLTPLPSPSSGSFSDPAYAKCFDKLKGRFTCTPNKGVLPVDSSIISRAEKNGDALTNPEERQVISGSARFGSLVKVGENQIASTIGSETAQFANNVQLINGHVIEGSGVTSGSGTTTKGLVVQVKPLRFTIQNPFNNPKAPAWVVDMYALKVGLDAIHSPIQRFRDLENVKLGAGGFIVHQFFHIHPTDAALIPALKSYQVLLKPEDLVPYHQITKTIINNMAVGDILIQADQIAASAQFSAGPTAFIGLGLSASAGANVAKIKQLVILKDDPKSISFSWLNGRSLGLGASYNPVAVLQPLIGFVYRELKTSQLNYRVPDWNGLGDDRQTQLVHYLREPKPPKQKEDPAFFNLRYQNRDFSRRASTFVLSNLGFHAFDTSHESIHANTVTTNASAGSSDLLENSKIRSDARLREKQFPLSFGGQKEDVFRVQVATLNGQTPIMRINQDYERYFASRKDFQGLLDNQLKWIQQQTNWPQVTAGMINIRAQDLSFRSETLISEKGTENIFGADRASKFRQNPTLICQDLVKLLPEIEGTESSYCDRAIRNNSDGLNSGKARQGIQMIHLFIERYQNAAKEFETVKASQKEDRLDKLNSAISNLFYIKELSYVVISELLNLAGKQNIYFESARLDLASGFPDGSSYSVMPSALRGGLLASEGQDKITKMKRQFRYTMTPFDLIMSSLYNFVLNDYIPSMNTVGGEVVNRFNVVGKREFEILDTRDLPSSYAPMIEDLNQESEDN